MFVLLEQGGCPVARRVRPWDRLLVRLRACSLDIELAHGACPDETVALSLRAQMLLGQPARRNLALGAQRVLAMAARPQSARHPQIPVCRDRVRDSAEEIGELIRRLLSADPVAARGVAQASVLLSDAGSPLYRRASDDDLRSRVDQAASALSPLSDWAS
jgi:hypothetical protein